MNLEQDDMGYKVDGLGAEKDNGTWEEVESDVLEVLVKEKGLDDIWIFKNIYPKLEISLVKKEVNYVSYIIKFDYKKYRFSYEKRQSIWFRITFNEMEVWGEKSKKYFIGWLCGEW